MTTTGSTPSTGLTDDQLAELHRVQLHIAQQVKRVCDAHGLEYFLIAGTLLGAVRHGGFIPWDDDMDLGMPRDSYDRFLQVAPEELGPDFFVQTLDTDPGYGLFFAKVRKNGTKIVEAASAESRAHNGIFIDIFPFDNVPDNKWQQCLHAKFTLALKRLFILNRGYTPWAATGQSGSLTQRFFMHVAKVLPALAIKTCANKSMRQFNSQSTELLTTLGGSYGYEKESIRRQWIGELTPETFEQTSFNCLDGSHEYLTKLYGNYMAPPPPADRSSRHGVMQIDFGPTKT